MNLREINIKQSQDVLMRLYCYLALFLFLRYCLLKNKFSYFTFLYLNKTANRNCKDKCIRLVSVRSVSFNRAVFLMESTLNIIIITKRDDLLLILNILFNECL